MKEKNEPLVILITDDNVSEMEALARILGQGGYAVLEARDGEKGLEILRKQHVDLLITDLKMPGLGGEELLKVAKTLKPDLEVIVITGQGTIEDAVETMKMGAYDFIEKPIKKAILTKTVEKALEKQALQRRNMELSRLIEDIGESRRPIGKSQNFLQALALAGEVAPSEATILIRGESGTGKEIFADFIQKRSARYGKPFVKINCAAVPENLLESELFGYERGAFTGAVSRKPGRFELANTGTLFLDEVSEMSPPLQAKLLRFIENGEFQRVGGTEPLKSDVRIMAATNANLEEKVKARAFREDLYYRLNVIQIAIPPLRERRADVALLANHFLGVYARKNGKSIKGIQPEALRLLENHAWPGNVRELENVIERAVVLSKGEEITVKELPADVAAENFRAGYVTFSIGTSLDEMEKKMIEETLKYASGDKDLAAKMLGTSSRTIYRRTQSAPQEEGA